MQKQGTETEKGYRQKQNNERQSEPHHHNNSGQDEERNQPISVVIAASSGPESKPDTKDLHVSKLTQQTKAILSIDAEILTASCGSESAH